MERSVKEKMEEYREKVNHQREEIRKRIVGLPSFIESLFICFYSHSEGDLIPHILVEGKVGEGKTVTLKAFTSTISGASFSRIQFTPDLKPFDLIRIVEQREDRTLEFYPGPLFANLILADEINRAHEKTRSALLEAMGEEQITIGRTTYRLERPFFVMATENPIDIEGTYMLGAAQLDRFMMKIYTESPTEEEEILIAKMHQEKTPALEPIVSKEEALKIRDFIREHIFIDEKLQRTMVKIVRALRVGGKVVPPEDFYLLPEGKRGYLFLERGCQVRAFLYGRNYVVLDDIESLVVPILGHRIGMKYGGNSHEWILKAVKRVREDEAR